MTTNLTQVVLSRPESMKMLKKFKKSSWKIDVGHWRSCEVIWSSVHKILTENLGIKRITTKFVTFLNQKWHSPCALSSLIHPTLPSVTFLFPWMKKTHERKAFCRHCRGEEKDDKDAVEYHRRWIKKNILNNKITD